MIGGELEATLNEIYIYIDTHTLFSIRFNTIKQNISNVLYRGNCVKILLNMNKFRKVVTSTMYKGGKVFYFVCKIAI